MADLALAGAEVLHREARDVARDVLDVWSRRLRASCSPVRALIANGTSCSDSARLRAVTVISPSAVGSSCAIALCASTSATAVATSDAGRSRMFLFMFLPLF